MIATDVTLVNVDGSGVFDQFMRAVRSQLQEEFEHGRISGSDFATALAAVIPQVLQTSVSYVLSKPLEDAKAAAALLDNQITAVKLTIAEGTRDAAIRTATMEANKADADAQLVFYKAMEARSAVSDTVCTSPNDDTLVAVTGSVGEQRLLVREQTNGFRKNAATAFAKVYADNVSMRLNTSSTYALPESFSDARVNDALTRAFNVTFG